MRIQKDAMDRKVFAACALAIAPAVLSPGCDRQPVAPPPDAAPLVLAELKQHSPGPWRRPDHAPVAPTSLEQPDFDPLGRRPASLDPSDVNELRMRMIEPTTAPRKDTAEAQDAVAPEEAGAASAPEQAVLPPYDLRITESAAEPPATIPSDPQPELIDPAVPQQPAATAAVPAPEAQSATPPRVLSPVEAAPAMERLPAKSATIAPEQSPLPWAASAPMTPEMRAVLEEAEVRIRQAFRLAQRDALYLAQEEFVAALSLVAQANDMQRGTQFFTESLDAGLVALEESREFVQPRTVGKRLDLSRIVAGHRTPVLKNESLESMPPAVAARRYYAYAQEQLSGASAGEPRNSIALYGLGKLVTASTETSPHQRLEGTARAMVLHQAALMADRKNYRAANELAVILARSGDLAHARDLLAHSVRLAPHPVPYHNLAVVLANLGEPQLAQRATNEALALERQGYHRGGPVVQWVDSTTFASTAPPSNAALPPVQKTPAVETPQAGEQAPVSTAKKTSDWLPWTRR